MQKKKIAPDKAVNRKMPKPRSIFRELDSASLFPVSQVGPIKMSNTDPGEISKPKKKKEAFIQRYGDIESYF